MNRTAKLLHTINNENHVFIIVQKEVLLEVLLVSKENLENFLNQDLNFWISAFENKNQVKITTALSSSSKFQNQRIELLEQKRSWIYIKEEAQNSSDDFQRIKGLNFLGDSYGSDSYRAMMSEAKRKKKMLLHICCGPDAAGVINQLKDNYELVCFWYDPNIQPKEEHDKRLEAFVKVAELENVPYVVGEYDVDHFYERIKGLEHTPEQGAKCSQCYDMRLERAALEAKDQNCDLYTTTLAISPHKVQEKLKNFGELNFKKHGIPYMARNFMKHEGFKKSVEYTEAHDIYRQDYCGCYFSLYEGGPQAQKQAQELGLTKDVVQNEGFQNPFVKDQRSFS